MVDEIKKETPKEEVVKQEEIPIYVMPEKFFGLEPGVKPPEPPKVIVKEVIKEVPAGPKPTPSAPAKPPAKKRLYILLGIIGIVILLGGAAFYVLRPYLFQEPVTPPKVVTPPANVAPPVTQPAPPPSQPATTTPAIPEEKEIPLSWESALDSDGDGLTDDEELTYGTDVNKPDTDEDGFLDGHEVFHLYNPNGKTPVKLLDTGSVRVYRNAKAGYEIFYPSPWTVEVIDAEKGQTIFRSPIGEFVQVLIEENLQKLPIVNWYLALSPGTPVGQLQTFVTKSNFDGIKSPDRLNAYFSSNGSVYVISNNIGNRVSVSFYRTYEMMLNSFKIIR